MILIASATTLPSVGYTVYDIIATLASELYPAIIPILTVVSIIFAAFWIWHKTAGILRKIK